ncbi:2125_t:CDS:2, partial [Funneliformis geosporum]
KQKVFHSVFVYVAQNQSLRRSFFLRLRSTCRFKRKMFLKNLKKTKVLEKQNNESEHSEENSVLENQIVQNLSIDFTKKGEELLKLNSRFKKKIKKLDTEAKVKQENINHYKEIIKGQAKEINLLEEKINQLVETIGELNTKDKLGGFDILKKSEKLPTLQQCFPTKFVIFGILCVIILDRWDSERRDDCSWICHLKRSVENN